MDMDPLKLKPFDLEKAKAGKPFVQFYNGILFENNFRFIGTTTRGDIVYEYGVNGNIAFRPPTSLRMLPEFKKAKFFLYRNTNKAVHVCSDTERNRKWAKIYDRPIIKEFEVEYEE